MLYPQREGILLELLNKCFQKLISQKLQFVHATVFSVYSQARQWIDHPRNVILGDNRKEFVAMATHPLDC